MAILDAERGLIVVRIVYDGPALAGKTSSVRALARSLGRPVFSGLEAEGRTLHLDWLDYVGGRFDGHAIRCQVVAVPGQPALASRRQRLLDGADAVVFVTDSRRDALDESLRSLEELRAFIQHAAPPAPGVVLQANKRDDAAAVPLDELRARLGVGPTVGVTQSVAVDGTGVRETFVLAVRLALDRVRETMTRKTLAFGTPETDSGEALLAALLKAEGGEPLPVAAPAPKAPAAPAPVVEAAPAAPAPTGETRPPDASLAPGLVWPPIEGRLVLHEAQDQGLASTRLENGDWWASGGPWRGHSAGGAVFATVEAGREALVEWARWHASLARVLSPRRCIALGGAAEGAYRIWQIVKREASVKEMAAAALAGSDADAAAITLVSATNLLLEAERKLVPLGLPVTAGTVGLLDGALSYVGLAPHPSWRPSGAATPAQRVRAAFGPIFERALPGTAVSVPRLLDRLRARASGTPAQDLVETLQALLIGH